MLTLPSFEILKPQPKVPHVARTLTKKTVDGVEYTVRQGRNGKDWWISASLQGLRMSNTLHTTKAKTATEWILAVETGKIRVTA
jgi:hypothetical protein